MNLDALRGAAAAAAEREDRAALLSALRVLAGALEEAGEREEALQIHEQVIQLDPADAGALAALGRSAPPPLGSGAGRARARGDGVGLGDKMADNGDGEGTSPVKDVLELGLAYAEMELWGEAIARFEEAVALDPEYRPTAEAILSLVPPSGGRGAGEGWPEDERLRMRYLLGRSAEVVGNRGSAREFYEDVVSLDPTFQDAVQRLRHLEG
jgi:tetratricopeptide (TPR) repeat protein